MQASDLRAALAEIGISQAAFADLAGVNPRTVRRWVDQRREEPLSRYATMVIEQTLKTAHRASLGRIPRRGQE